MTTPYVTGTVSVTAGSAIVTGVGTGWLTSGLVAGQFGLDSANGNPVPVLSIDSDTQITLAKPWRGTTASAQGYWITYDTTPGQQTVANAQRLAEYIARLDKPALAALASLTPAADKLPYFGAQGLGALADFNAAARALLAGGVLSDGQLPGRLRADTATVGDANLAVSTGFYNLTDTAINVPYPGFWTLMTRSFGGNWNQSIQNIVNGQIFSRFSVSGTISAWRKSDPPERGSNANGEYVRFADGTQICTGFFVGYQASTIKFNVAAANFISAPNPCFISVTPYQILDSSALAWSDVVNGINFLSQVTSTTNRVDWAIIGKWY